MRSDAPNLSSTIHGEQHWQAVARSGLELIRRGAAGSPTLVVLFGLLHDSQRLDDGADRGHGKRAATYTRTLTAAGVVELQDDELETLCAALARHDAQLRTTDPAIAVCFDADRLNLWRVGREPNPHFLSTAQARDPALIAEHAESWRVGDDWHELWTSAGLSSA